MRCTPPPTAGPPGEAGGRLSHQFVVDMADRDHPRTQPRRQRARLIALSTLSWTTVVCTSSGAVFTFGGDKIQGDDQFDSLAEEDEPACSPFWGHGEVLFQPVPRPVEALGRKMMIGASAAGGSHTAAWTDAGELFTFGDGDEGQLCLAGAFAPQRSGQRCCCRVDL